MMREGKMFMGDVVVDGRVWQGDGEMRAVNAAGVDGLFGIEGGYVGWVAREVYGLWRWIFAAVDECEVASFKGQVVGRWTLMRILKKAEASSRTAWFL